MEFENLMKLIQTVSASELTEFKYEEKGMKVSMGKKQGVYAANEMKEFIIPAETVNKAAAEMVSMAAVPSENAENTAEGNIIMSPLVGTFYAAPQEDAEPFVKAGDRVEKGQVMAIIEAMKLMNEIESDYSGTVAEVYVENGQAVEYGQPLFRIA